MKDPTVANLLLPLLVVLPLGGAFLALALGRFWSRAGRLIAVAFTAATLVLSASLMWAGVRGTVWVRRGGTTRRADGSEIQDLASANADAQGPWPGF